MSILRRLFGGNPKNCDRCGSSQKDLCVWDSTYGGRLVADKPSLCSNCVRTAVAESFRELEHPCVAVEPVLNKGGYYALTLDGVREFWGPNPEQRISDAKIENKTNEIVDTLRRIADAAGDNCASCGAKAAQLCWVSADAFEGRWDRFFALVERGELVESTPLCGDCAGKTFVDVMDARDLRIDTIWPPGDSTLVIVSAEA